MRVQVAVDKSLALRQVMYRMRYDGDIHDRGERALVLLSGGIDSATCLYWAKSKGYDVHALTLNYYNRWVKEIEATRLIAREADTRLIELDIPFVKEAFDIYGYREYRDGDMRWSSYIPSKNLLFYSIAAHLAEYMRVRWIVGGHNRDDTLFFTDTRREYIDGINRLFRQGFMLNEPAEIVTPLLDLSKVDVIRLALHLGVPLEHTWSCHTRAERHCGRCHGCRSRKDVFNAIGIMDTVEYEQ
ncbi:MAG: 7-cyano-7-deazaguanine synthase [Candidatus Nitrosocaldus sp.]|nr:7-cyano-7-deazaguanine synthase [Candidatus Nitrosocaldus sp.]MCS7140676.1 7-cyano-7-deazaguanine synthase [Candidatus Nitrosocaldus sp.]MDW8275097.1 7-cyano-7-deazaguanine synthase [Candidatus Nitrosocaldus sp.]